MTRWHTPSLLVGIVLALLALGIVMLASASSVRGDTYLNDPQYFLKRQLVWLAFAVIAGTISVFMDYHFWRKYALWIGGISLFFLAVVLIPGIGMRIGGSRRWLHLGPLSLQPSELGKIAMVILVAWWITRKELRMHFFKEGIFQPMVGLGLFCGLIILEPDFGTTALVGLVGFLMLYLGGARPLYLGIIGALGLAAFAIAVIHDPVRMGRVMAFLRPDLHPALAYHVGQSKDAFTMGGFLGAGLGESLQKHFYLPEAHTDFIFAIIGEELGLMATISVVLLFGGILLCGLSIAWHAPDVFGRHLAFGLTMLNVVQAAINIGVVTGCLPTKGLPLPFISYGGSSLIMSLVGIGILLNISRKSIQLEDDEQVNAVRDKGHWI